MNKTAVVLDTNVFVSAGFNDHSHSARIIDRVRQGDLRMVWTEATRAEIRHILTKIPPLSWEPFADLFREDDRFSDALDPDRYTYISDPADRKFLAVAEATGATLITSDDDLLAQADRASVPVLMPADFAG